ncbi:MAG: hypothetical protein V4587_16425 [Acidobacteriota bacterium]
MRPLREEESKVLEALLGMASSNAKPPSEDELFAVDLADGGMGSIRLTDKLDRARKMGRELIVAEYIDEDQVPVSISVNLDQDGRLFELDFWKVDFNPLKRYPRPEEVHADPPAATIDRPPTRS